MAKKNTDHVVIRNEKLFCENCGRSQAIPLPMEIPVFVAMSNAFEKSHRNCPKTWVQPEMETDEPLDKRIIFWLSNGERGISSETIYSTITGNPVKRYDHPYDPSDFRRCYLLLKLIPEWKPLLPLMKKVSKPWSNLVDNWDKLTEMLEEQMQTKEPNGMYEFMQTLIN